VLVLYRVTIHNKYSNCPLSEVIHTWPRLFMDSRNLREVTAQLRMVRQVPKMCWWSDSSFSIGDGYTRIS